MVQGQDIYKSKQVRDKQIVRILGKVLFVYVDLVPLMYRKSVY